MSISLVHLLLDNQRCQGRYPASPPVLYHYYYDFVIVSLYIYQCYVLCLIYEHFINVRMFFLTVTIIYLKNISKENQIYNMRKRLAHIIKYCIVIMYTLWDANVISQMISFPLLNKEIENIDGITLAFDYNEKCTLRFKTTSAFLVFTKWKH